jgi:hypothetical protein
MRGFEAGRLQALTPFVPREVEVRAANAALKVTSPDDARDEQAKLVRLRSV